VGVNIYAGLTIHGATIPHFVTGTSGQPSQYTNKQGQPARNITTAEYHDVLTKTLLPEGSKLIRKGGVSTPWTFQQDNDPTHKRATAVIQQFSNQHTTPVQLLQPWPGNSPDLSPIENVWSYVDRKLKARVINNLQEFKTAVQEELANLPSEYISSLFNSMPRRMKAVIQEGGGRIDY
jgi:hypothetical protein